MTTILSPGRPAIFSEGRAVTKHWLRMAAHHEAGHAVVAEHFDFAVLGITLNPPATNIHFPRFMTRGQILKRCTVLHAGYIASKIYLGESWSYDETRVHTAVKDMDEANEICQRANIEWTECNQRGAVELVKKLWPEIETRAGIILYLHKLGF